MKGHPKRAAQYSDASGSPALFIGYGSPLNTLDSNSRAAPRNPHVHVKQPQAAKGSVTDVCDRDIWVSDIER
jgi:hypothetical protein